MCKRWVVVCYLTAATSLGAAAVGLGQTGERPLQKLFGGATPKSSPAEELRRRAEIDIELAWLADPITFPYFLEARLEGSTLSVRGYVPDKTVRAQALKLARLHTAYTVADMLKEHPSLLVRPTKETPSHLQTVAVATLKEALPKQYQRLQVQCAADGTVTLLGSVQSVEDKLAASLAAAAAVRLHERAEPHPASRWAGPHPCRAAATRKERQAGRGASWAVDHRAGLRTAHRLRPTYPERGCQAGDTAGQQGARTKGGSAEGARARRPKGRKRQAQCQAIAVRGANDATPEARARRMPRRQERQD